MSYERFGRGSRWSGSPDPLPAHDAPQVERKLCQCETPDPVMQADRRFYCHTCSFQVPAVICGKCCVTILSPSEAPRLLDDRVYEIWHGAIPLKWVRAEAYATLEAEKQQLEAENREARQKLDMADWNKAIGKMRIGMPDYQARAEAAESQLHTLRDAVREWDEADRAWNDEDASVADHEALAAMWGRVVNAKEAMLALVTPQGEK